MNPQQKLLVIDIHQKAAELESLVRQANDAGLITNVTCNTEVILRNKQPGATVTPSKLGVLFYVHITESDKY